MTAVEWPPWNGSHEMVQLDDTFGKGYYHTKTYAMQLKFYLITFLILNSTSLFAQGGITGKEIITRQHHAHLQYNPEYIDQLEAYNQQFMTIDSCHHILEKASYTIEKSRFSRWQKQQVLEVIDAAKNDKAGDIYDKFSQFDDPFMNRIKETIRISNLYECEIAILKSNYRKKEIEKWADNLAFVVNDYFYDEFQNFEFTHRVQTYQQLLPLEKIIDQMVKIYVAGEFNINNFQEIEKFYRQWYFNRELVRYSTEREELFQLLKVKLDY